jgi:2-polyprenyl-3-methyl-5-hydroxy-6-metoxy-1,4-benzoquinol methylase
MRALLALMEASSINPRRVLEVAAGDAALSACLQHRGASAVANDLREEGLRSALSRFTNGGLVSVAPGNLFELDPAQLGQFDLVIACEVLEHVAHPDRLIAHLKSFMTEQGRMLLTTPNGSFFRNRLQTYSQVADTFALEERQFLPDADGHLFLITPEEMHSLAASAGLRVERLSVWGTPFLSGHAGLARLAPLLPMRLSYLAEASCQRLPHPLLNRLGNSISALLRN